MRLEIWVCSAGYGLLELTSPVRPYAATFSPKHADSVAPPGSAYTAADWWQRIAGWCPEGVCGPRTVSDLVKRSTTDFVLVAVSGVYAAALSADLCNAAVATAGGERFAVISAGARPPNLPDEYLIQADARLKLSLGGAMQSVNARIARKAVNDAALWFPNRSSLRSLVESWLTKAPPFSGFDRERLSDESIRAFILASLRRDPALPHTRLLRALRDGGQACEQARFAALFREVEAAMRAER
jgi:hypothetical protein